MTSSSVLNDLQQCTLWPLPLSARREAPRVQAVRQGLCPAAPPEEAHALRPQHRQAVLLRELQELLQGIRAVRPANLISADPKSAKELSAWVLCQLTWFQLIQSQLKICRPIFMSADLISADKKSVWGVGQFDFSWLVAWFDVGWLNISWLVDSWFDVSWLEVSQWVIKR